MPRPGAPDSGRSRMAAGPADARQGLRAAEENTRLMAAERDFTRRARHGVAEVSRAALALANTCAELNRLMLGLDSIRVLCRVEAGRIAVGGDGLHAIILTLDRFHADVERRLEGLLDLSRHMRSAAEAALRADKQRPRKPRARSARRDQRLNQGLVPAAEFQSASPITRATARPSGSTSTVNGRPSAPIRCASAWLRVEVDGEVRDPRLLQETVHCLRLVEAGGDRQNFETVTAEIALQRVQRRHLLAAGRAPGGPEVQQHPFAAPFRQPMLGPVAPLEQGIGHGLGRGDGQFVHAAALHQRAQIRLCCVRGCGEVCAKREARVEDGEDQRAEHGFSMKDGDDDRNDTGATGGTPDDAGRNAMWGGRFAAGPDAIMEAINASIGFDRRLAAQDIAGSRAHAAMLAAQGILTDSDAQAIREGLLTVLSEIEAGEFAFSTALEDIHMNVEARLKEIVGPAAGRLHTARSRNDQVALDFRIWTRDQADAAIQGLTALMRALLGQADQGADWVMPGFTHLQTAQPVTWGHHMMAYVEMFARDRDRFRDARARMNESPLGAAALAGTSFPIDRHMTAEALGFDRPMANSLDAVSDRDFALEFLSAASICAMHLSRLSEELVIWSSAQFRFVTLSDGFSTGSSIMPQKKNPDAAELIRAKIGRILGATVALFTVMKGLPLAYGKDMQEDKEQVFDAADTLMLSLAAMEGMVRDMAANRESLRAAASSGFSTATDLADWLVRELDLPFRDAHHVTGALVARAEARGCDLPDLTLEEMQAEHAGITEGVFDVLGVENSVASRQSYGGTAPDQVRAQVARWRELLG